MPVTEEIAEETTSLLKETGLHGHKYAIDEAPAAVALRQPGPVTVFTSDEAGMRKLCADGVVVPWSPPPDGDDRPLTLPGPSGRRTGARCPFRCIPPR
ncbi:hypothetical protein GCM10017776_53680 [Streptomyces griseoluteus]|nr:hypothetical protein GCM10017776_53680 [Streptomyces griseoluteus]